MASAASYVLFSMKTETQVRNRLADQFTNTETMEGWAKFTDTALEETIRRLNELGYLDDTAYCKKIHCVGNPRETCITRGPVKWINLSQRRFKRDCRSCGFRGIWGSFRFDRWWECVSTTPEKNMRTHTGRPKKNAQSCTVFWQEKDFLTISVDAALQRIKRRRQGRQMHKMIRFPSFLSDVQKIRWIPKLCSAFYKKQDTKLRTERDADIIIVNTCGFIESAKTEAIEAILDAASYKSSGRCKSVIAAGALRSGMRKTSEKSSRKWMQSWESVGTERSWMP